MLIEVEDRENIRIITLCPRIDIHNVFDVEEQVLGQLETAHPLVVFDFSKVEYFGSNGIRIVMLAKRTLEKMGGRLVLATLNQFVIKILKAIDLMELFTVEDNVEDAVTELKSGA